MGTVAVRVGRNGKTEWKAEPIYGGLLSPGPDPAELRAWVFDDAEMGERVAGDFVTNGRCPAGALDQHFFEVQLRKFPDPEDAPKRKAGLGKACLCQEQAHFFRLHGPGGVHSGLPASRPLNGIFWTAKITFSQTDSGRAGL